MRSFATLALATILIAGLGGCPSTEKAHATDELTSASPDVPVHPPNPAPDPVHGVPCEQGPIRFEPASEAERAAIVRAYHDQNGGLGASPDPLGRYITAGGFGFGSAPRRGPVRGASDAEMETSARAFLHRNATYFGVSPDEVQGLRVRSFDRWGSNSTTVNFASSASLRGYESFGLHRDLQFSVGVSAEAEVLSVTNRSQLLPPFALCTEPALAATDPQVRAGALGQRTFFHDVGGGRVEVGPAEEKDLGPPKLTIFVRIGSETDDTVVALAYEMSFFGRGFSAFVDANTGELLAIRRHFAT